MNKLEQALQLLGYESGKAVAKHTLVSNIAIFACVTDDTDLEALCVAELDKLKAEIKAEQNK